MSPQRRIRKTDKKTRAERRRRRLFAFAKQIKNLLKEEKGNENFQAYRRLRV